MEERVPVEEHQQVVAERVGDEHLAGEDQVEPRVDRGRDAGDARRPGLERKDHKPDAAAAEPGEQDHRHDADRIVDHDRRDRKVVDAEDRHHRQRLGIERGERRGGDGDGGRHRRMQHHRRGRPFGPRDGAHRLGVGHEEEDAAHQVEDVVAADGGAAHAENLGQRIEHGDEDQGLEDIVQKSHQGVGMPAPHRPDGVVVDEIERAARRPPSRLPRFNREHDPPSGLVTKPLPRFRKEFLPLPLRAIIRGRDWPFNMNETEETRRGL